MENYKYNVKALNFSDFHFNNSDNCVISTEVVERKSKKGNSRETLTFYNILNNEVLSYIKQYTEALSQYDSIYGYVPGERTYIHILRTHIKKNFNLDIPTHFFVAKIFGNKIKGYEYIKDLIENIWSNNQAKTYMFNQFNFIHINGNLHDYRWNNIAFEPVDKIQKRIEEVRYIVRFFHDNKLYSDEKYRHIENKMSEYINQFYADRYGPSVAVHTQCQDKVRKNSKVYVKFVYNGKTHIIKTECPYLSPSTILKCGRDIFNIDLAKSTKQFIYNKYTVLNKLEHTFCIRDGSDNGIKMYKEININTMEKTNNRFSEEVQND